MQQDPDALRDLEKGGVEPDRERVLNDLMNTGAASPLLQQWTTASLTSCSRGPQVSQPRSLVASLLATCKTHPPADGGLRWRRSIQRNGWT